MKFKNQLLKSIVYLVLSGLTLSLSAQTISIDASSSGRKQVIDGFGTCLSGTSGEKSWFQNLYYDDAECSILRVDLVPRFASPYSDNTYNSPWFHNNPALPGPDGNNVRTYTNASDYTRTFDNKQAQIAVMSTDIQDNISKFDYNSELPRVGIAMAKKGVEKRTQLGDFKLTGSIWSPAPWLKISSGNTNSGNGYPLPINNPTYPFIWFDNFSGGKLDVSNTPLPVFFDGEQNTSALTQFARSTAAYIKGYQDKVGAKFYALSIQNELNFETFYNSAFYPLSSQYIAALKAVRAEFDKYPDLKDIKLIGPEDLLSGPDYALWQYGGGATAVHKNLQYLTEIAKDPVAQSAIDFYCIHGYSADGIGSAGANPVSWDRWSNGWENSPAAGIPANVKGFTAYNKKSWMTETSGEKPEWLSPSSGFPNQGAFSIALNIHQALTTGNESAYVYWQMSDGKVAAGENLTDESSNSKSPKYNAFKHFSKFIKPNSVRLQTSIAGGNSTLNVSAYIHDENNSLTIVIVNASASTQTVTVNIPSVPFILNELDSYTSSNDNYWEKNIANINAGNTVVNVPAYGIVTLYGKDKTITGFESKGTELSEDVFLYPNPVNNLVNIKLGASMGENVEIVISDLLSNELSRTSFSNSENAIQLDVSSLSAGVYYFNIKSGNNEVVKKVFVDK